MASRSFSSMACCTGQWKGIRTDTNPTHNTPIFISLPGNSRPLVINPADPVDISLAHALAYSNQFKARPLKHWRKQSGDDNNRQSSHSKRLMQQYNSPGGYRIHSNDTDTPCDVSGTILGYADYTLGKEQPTTRDISGCLIYDITSKAKQRTRSSYIVKDPSTNNSYGSYHQYNHARCYDYGQNLNGKLGRDDSYDLSGCDVDNLSRSCRRRAWEKPNNKNYWQQGAVSSGSRILRLKLNTVNKAANNTIAAYGHAAGNALTYNGNPAAPFILKSKSANCNHVWRSGSRLTQEVCKK